MDRLWMCLAVLAIFGKTAYPQDGWYYDESLEDNYGSIEHMSEENTKSDTKFDIQDYQFEDNRSELNDDSAENIQTSKENTGTLNKIAYLSSREVENLGIGNVILDNDQNNILETTTKGDDDAQNLNMSKENFEKDIFADTKAILSEETENDFNYDSPVQFDTENASDISEIIAETTKILNETKDTMEENKNISGEDKILHVNSNNITKNYSTEIDETTEKDTVNLAIEDLMTDLNKLQETWSKLNDFHDFSDDSVNMDYENDDNFKLSEDSDDYEQFFSNNTVDYEKKTIEIEEDISDEVFPDDSPIEKESKTSNPIIYLNDALPADSESDQISEKDKTEFISSSTQSTSTYDSIKSSNTNLLVTKSMSSTSDKIITPIERNEVIRTTPDINDLSSTEVRDMTDSFDSEHTIKEITENDMRNAENIWLSYCCPTVITSPGYPSPYPTNTTTDWMFTGYGHGIELNVTDLFINGHRGDYLLFKPGGVDESGSSGLLFSYILRKERHYRFLDVDKMFVRFVAMPGSPVLRGFSFSVRMAVPGPEMVLPEPEPAPIIPSPPESITLNLGGISAEGFFGIQEKFREIIAGMAEMYIQNNGIPPGINTTLELTQITSVGMCFHNWPKFEQCVEVAFGVALVYDDDDEEREPRLNAADLTKMWETYSQAEPFAVQLRSLGITEYEVPNDRAIITVWLVIAGGVVISMAMLAFALWRFSCFDNYTRMPAFSDTESINEKRNLDLYPTPHQTLPPLYSETDYKWADAKYDDSAKVHAGGFSNKSYMREDMYDLDSDEDIVPVSARNTSFSPRDIYSV